MSIRVLSPPSPTTAGVSLQTVELSAGESTATVNLLGATLVSWTHRGTELLFVSKKAVYDNKKAIRGGIPVVFPQFGAWDNGRPQHGFARSTAFAYKDKDSVAQRGSDGNDSAMAVFELSDSEATRAMWNHPFRLVYTVTLTPKSLEQHLVVHNTGTEEFSFTTLLHTYFRTDSLKTVTVAGLTDRDFKDKVDNMATKHEDRDVVTVSELTDRIYMKTLDEHLILNLAGGKGVQLVKENMPDTVVWNPAEEGGKAIADLGGEEVNHFICVEAGAVVEPVTVAANSSKSFRQTLKL
ncbi:hypothetical protein CAOG_08635 [Capsaspora owczarzaki ATCC 30864]|uniref:glucose-6-phosphate 1-epimerase n=1 Tax=Capsaspora owczarzaki (strain ATCC 30864) TaxID=595528 RepID=A0A0D2WN45_CAPO3|nr:hypothetical protein CAOG_08635 [Capsaspora owczarzaki ATCC 30864]KJE91743.1 hypothetical protein CAOG_008635 [Capsaspora owczarzaki ATCC 30864]|eukprot:XP_011270246.1 hypothetical protein CAOG_08635 [Capsaspora owczarzaki ATCC 30864]